MNRLTAYRTFGNPKFTPAKRTRIFAERYYTVRMQNVERDMGDGCYLADGEYEELLPGSAARKRRDAHLNHCNAIREHNGPVFAVLTSQYGRWDTTRTPIYAASQAAAVKIVEREEAAHIKWIADCRKAANDYREKAKADSFWAKSAEQADAVADKHENTFKAEVLQVRK